MQSLSKGAFLFLAGIILYAQNVGIGTPTPDASAILELNATDKGLLVPRLTTAQRNAIAAPAEGLIIYNLDTKCLEVYSGTMWVNLCQTCTSTPPPPNINGPTEICFGENYAFWGSGAPSGAIYVWTTPSGATYTGDTLKIINASSADTGWYYLRYYWNGCYSLIDSLHVIESQATWTAMAPFPGTDRAQWYTPYFVIGSRLYIVGGWRDATTNLNDCWYYDMATNTWSPCANYPLAHISHATGLSYGNGKGYVVGGRASPTGTYISNAYVYDPGTNTWSPIANFPRTIGSTFRSATTWTGLGLPCGSDGILYRYNTLSNIWTAMTTYPAGGTPYDGSFRFTFEDGTYVYIGGGHSNCPCCSPKYLEMRRFAKATGGGWQLRASVPASAAPIIANPVYINGKAYAVGSDYYLWEYDIATDTWNRKCSVPAGFLPGISAAYNNEAFFIDLKSKLVYKYTP